MTRTSTLSPGLAREYSASSTYEVGQYVLWRNAYWKCSVAISVPEEWTPGHWTLDDDPLDHKADLVDGKVPAAQLPSYVDDVVEGYYHEGAFYKDQEHSEEIVPEESKIYVDKSSGGGNKCYRWSGSMYVEISPAPDLSNYYNKGEVDGLLAGKASKADATLTERGPDKDGFSAWTVFREGVDVTAQVTEMPRWIKEADAWLVQDTFVPGDSSSWDVVTAGQDALYLTWRHVYRGIDGVIDVVYTATRTALPGYQLGDQDDKLLASETEAEELRQGKQDTLTFDNAPTSGSNNPVKSGGIWSALWGAATTAFSSMYDWCVDQLTGKLNNTTDTMSGSLTVQGSLTVGSRKSGSVIGTQSTAEGTTTTASATGSHAEGNTTTASGFYSHAEGVATTANATGSHVEGVSSRASGQYSHVEGTANRAENASEHAQGQYNVSHKASTTFGSAGNTLSSIGFGSENNDRKNAVETMQDGKTYIYGLGDYDGTNPTNATDLASVVNAKADKCVPQTVNNLAALTSTGSLADSGWTAGDLARYALVTKTISNGAVTLDDRTDNYVDARSLGSSDSLDIDFPALVDGKSRDFVLALECGATPPTISYAAYATIMAEDASALAPEEGMNIYAFTEFKPNMFLVSRKLVDTVVVNTPENTEQLLLAMQKRGIDTTSITTFGGVETALGLSDSDTPQDAIDAVMNN